VIPLQQEVDDILVIVSGQVRERSLKFEAIPNHATVDLFWLRHATVSNHLVELGYTHANVPGGFLA
jgi:hypothetical protein